MTNPHDYDPITHLSDEVTWLHARARRIIAEREARPDAPARSLRVVGKGKPANCCVEKHQEEERVIRENVDALLDARRTDGDPLPLDRLSQQFDLDPIGRMTILLATLPAIGVEAAELLGEIGPCGFAIGSPSPEIVANMLELDLRDRMGLRRTFAPTSPLMESGLVEIYLGRDPMPDDFPTAAIRMTSKGWTALTSLSGGDEEASEA